MYTDINLEYKLYVYIGIYLYIYVHIYILTFTSFARIDAYNIYLSILFSQSLTYKYAFLYH